MPFSAGQCISSHCTVFKCSVKQWSAVQYNGDKCSTVHCTAIHCNIVMLSQQVVLSPAVCIPCHRDPASSLHKEIYLNKQLKLQSRAKLNVYGKFLLLLLYLIQYLLLILLFHYMLNIFIQRQLKHDKYIFF